MLSQLITLKISSAISIFVYEHEHNLLGKNETYNGHIILNRACVINSIPPGSNEDRLESESLRESFLDYHASV